MAGEPTRLLIVDDSALYRQTIRNVLIHTPDVSIVGVARDGVDAVKQIDRLDPDLLTLDVQMPDMDGIGVLREINRRGLRCKAIMVSSLTAAGAQMTTDALLEGAFDFILKPSGSNPAENRQVLRDALETKITAFRQSVSLPTADRKRSRVTEAPPVIKSATGDAIASPPCRAVVIATSTGGPAALRDVLPTLRADLPVPVLVVQHMPPNYTRSLARRLDEICAIQVAEAANGSEVEGGRVLIAPGGQQMKLAGGPGRLRARVTDAPPENGCRPSADYLLRSATRVLGGQVLGVVMTGMGRDGLEGCRALKQSGGQVFAQHPDGCVVYGMPKAVIDDEIADRIIPLDHIGAAILSHVEHRGGG